MTPHPLTDYGIVYIATPYSFFPAGLDAAHAEASALTARLKAVGVYGFSPIAHSHSVAMHGDLDPLDAEMWLDWDERFMEMCDALAVAMLESWRASDGIAREIEFFEKALRPVWLLDPATLEVEPYAGW